MSSIADYLVSQGCTRTGALVLGTRNQLVKDTFVWSSSISLLPGPDFLTTFRLRYGVDYGARRSPLEVETLVEAFNQLSQALALSPLCGLPRGYVLTEQDKTDLFYVLGPRGTLAIRELVMPEVERVLGAGPEPKPTEPEPEPPAPPLPPVPPAPPAPPPVVPPAPAPVSPAPPLPVLALSPSALTTLAAISTWRAYGPGRIRDVRKLAQEIQAHLDSLKG